MLKLSFLIFIFLAVKFSNANIEISPQIVGGQNATLGQFPFVASYQRKEDRGRCDLVLIFFNIYLITFYPTAMHAEVESSMTDGS